MDIKNCEDIVVDGVDVADYPDFTDAYIASATCSKCGRELTEEECEKLTTDYPEVVHELAYQSLVTT